MNGTIITQDVVETPGFMVYFKGPEDKKFMSMDIKTGELFDRLMYAPIYPHKMQSTVTQWIEKNKICAPDCAIQIRVPGTCRIIYT